MNTRNYKTGVINDPLGQTKSLDCSEHCFRFKFVLFWKVGTDIRTDGRTNGQQVQKQWSLPAVTVGRPRGSIYFFRPKKQSSKSICTFWVVDFLIFEDIFRSSFLFASLVDKNLTETSAYFTMNFVKMLIWNRQTRYTFSTLTYYYKLKIIKQLKNDIIAERTVTNSICIVDK